MMLYTTILKKADYQDKEKIDEYLGKIEKKAEQMKQLTDHLFEYSLITGGTAMDLEQPERIKSVFYDLFSETSNYLVQNGFQVDSKVEWSSRKIRICMDYIMRIMDNITSNVIKYADKSKPVIISAVSEHNLEGYLFINKVSESSIGEKTDSNGIGINSIKNMVTKMGGKCLIEQKNQMFCLKILFPIVEE